MNIKALIREALQEFHQRPPADAQEPAAPSSSDPERERLAAELDALRTQLAQQQSDASRLAHAAAVEAWGAEAVRTFLLTPAAAEPLCDLAQQLTPEQFALLKAGVEAGGVRLELAGREGLVPGITALAATAARGDAGTAHDLATQLAKAEKISYSAAFTRVLQEHPDLAQSLLASAPAITTEE